MLPARKAHFTVDADEVFRRLAAEKQRQEQAVPGAYRYERPAVSRGVALWALMAVIVAIAVVLGLVAQ